MISAAEAEFQDAATWYRDRDPRVAAQFIEDTPKLLSLLEAFPANRWADLRDP